MRNDCTCTVTDLQPLDTENLFLFNEGSFNGLQAYKNSKAANVMFAYELARKLSGSGVMVNAVCPGKRIVELMLAWRFYDASDPDECICSRSYLKQPLDLYSIFKKSGIS